MNKASIVKKIGIYFMLMALFFASFIFGLFISQCSAEDNTITKVRVAYVYDGDYMYKTPQGEYKGYEVEYIYSLAQEANWQISFKDCHDSETSLADLKNNEVDILIGMAKTPEREKQYLFSDKKMVTSYMTLMVRPDDERYTFGDLVSLQNITTACRRGSVVINIYLDWCAQNNIKPNLLLFDNYKDALQALLDKKADSIVVGGVYALDNTRPVAQFSPADSYFMLAPNRMDIKRQLDAANDQLLVQNPLYEMSLFDKYFGKVQSNTPLFTPREKAYIKDAPTIKVAMLNNVPPYSYKGKDGSLQGVVLEYYKKLGAISGLKFAFQSYADFPTALAAVENKQADVLALYQQDIISAFHDNLILTLPYNTLNLAQVTKNGRTKRPKLALAQINDDVLAAARKKLNLSEVTMLPSVAGCFAALRDGQVDGVLCDMQTAIWFINSDRLDEYSLVSIPSRAWQVYSAMNSDKALLRSVLNKSILVSGDIFGNLLMQQNIQQQTGLLAVFNRIPRNWALAISFLSLISLILVLAAFWIIWHRHKAEESLAKEKAEAEKREAALQAETQANLAKFNFFSNLSHDMRTPLNGIIGFTDLALHEQNNANIPDYLEKIGISGHLMLDLVNDMLTVSRLENGKLSLNIAPITLFELFRQITVPVEVIAANVGVKFSFAKVGVEDCTILADKLNVQKIFLNLISNSLKFTEAGKKVCFKVRTEQAGPQKLGLVMTVEDEGKGISPAFLPHVFEAFAQEKDSHPKTIGTGLGLAIVKQLVTLMGGTIGVTSVQGHGSKFTVHLAFALTENHQQEKSTENFGGTQDQDFTGVLQDKTILLCEDNEINKEITCHLLKDKGMSVKYAADGQEGLNIFQNSPQGTIDAILMDNRMPVMDGIEATKAIRTLIREDARLIPIIALTADVFPDDLHRFLKAGMNAYIVKPIEPNLFYETIAKAIQKR